MKTIQVQDSSTVLPVGKILCLGRNYSEHAKELGNAIPSEPVVFMKPSSSIVYDGEDIIKPAYSNDIHHEVELVVAIGEPGYHIKESEAARHILGYAIGLDMTLRDVQTKLKKEGLPWFTAKGFHTSAAVSKIIPREQIKKHDCLEITCSVNGALRQKTTTDKMIFSIEKMISYLSTIVTLDTGDLIYTGTPEGVSSVFDGDIIEAELTGHIRIRNRIRFSSN